MKATLPFPIWPWPDIVLLTLVNEEPPASCLITGVPPFPPTFIRIEPPPVTVIAPLALKFVWFPSAAPINRPALDRLPAIFRSRLLVTVRLLPGSMTRVPTSTLMSRLTAAAAWPSLMQTATVALFGTASVLQFEALLQLLLPPPPIQMVAPDALHAVVPVKLNVAVTE